MMIRPTVDMRGASSVMTREGCIELQNSVLVGKLDATVHGVVDVTGISSVAVAASDNTAIHTGTVAVPRLEGNLWDWLTSRGVNNLDVERQGYTRIAIGDILADKLARDPCTKRQSWKVAAHGEILTVWAFGSLRLEDARSVARKDDIVRAVRRDRGVRVMVSVQDVLEVALDDTTLSTQVLDHSLAATD